MIILYVFDILLKICACSCFLLDLRGVDFFARFVCSIMCFFPLFFSFFVGRNIYFACVDFFLFFSSFLNIF
jgi:hypothetical protein